LGDGVFSHRHALAACEIIPGDGGTCQFVVAADEVGGDAVEGMGNAVALAIVDEVGGCRADYRDEAVSPRGRFAVGVIVEYEAVKVRLLLGTCGHVKQILQSHFNLILSFSNHLSHGFFLSLIQQYQQFSKLTTI
jgi:hypothetical protein